ncbi:hypothetical protein BKN84_21430 [Salmonella enterica]|nr:hypothetical protein [Salmonella enterica]EBQ2140028.1 hypothetical protein [Salmonella enterica]
MKCGCRKRLIQYPTGADRA